MAGISAVAVADEVTPVQVSQADSTTTTPVPTGPEDTQKKKDAPPADASQPQDQSSTEDQAGSEEVVVTGSRVKKTTFTSASPLQVIDGKKARELGLTSTADIIQQANVANGVQIDGTISGGYVTDSGPGSSTIGLRNLDASRTLVLINSRRLAPAGVEGAPVSPNLNLVPSSLVDRVEVLLDGASSVYGSDAVAGVVNVILRKNFEGWQVQGYQTFTDSADGAGETTDVNVLWGHSSGDYSVMVAGEYRDQKTLSFGDRDYSSECPVGGLNREVDVATGDILSFDRRGSNCRVPALVGYIANVGLYYTPGTSNVGIDNYSQTARNCDALTADCQQVNIYDEIHSRTTDRESTDLLPGIKTYSAYATGEYTIDPGSNMQAFTELSYNREEQRFNNGLYQVFPDVPETNPLNPIGDSAFGPGEGLDAEPVFAVNGERSVTDLTIEQYRGVLGVRGDMPFMNNLGLSNWTYEASVTYTKSVGDDSLSGIDNNRLLESLDNTVETAPGQYSCVTADNPGCVVINPFSDQLLGHGILTPEEKAYLYDTRTFHTTSEQIIYNAFITGDLFNLPGGPAQGVLGVEFRDDRLNSKPNDVARDGLLFGYSSDEGATGSASIFEAFSEVDLPVLKDKFLAKDLEFNASARWSNQEFYGAAWTYSLKGLYKPFDWITVRGTYGTSFRAPNLGEFFKAGQTGFGDGDIDPCVVPVGARVFDPTTHLNTYNPSLDERSATVLANCRAQGLDTSSLGLQGVPSIEEVTGGSKDLSAETSRAESFGLVLSQPWFEDVDFHVGATYYDIRVTNSIQTPSDSYILDNCYSQTPPGPFCSRITRQTTGLDAGLISLIDTSYLNVGLITSRGIDYNVFYSEKFEAGGKPLKLSIDAEASQTLENNSYTFGQLYAYKGHIGTPEWRGSIDGQAEWGPWTFLWRARFIGHQQDDFEYANQTCTYTEPAPSTAQDPLCTGAGGTIDPSQVTRVSKTYAEAYWEHDASVTYTTEKYDLTFGVQNLFDKDPIFVDYDSNTLVNSAGVPIGDGYDLLGRTFFVQATARF